MSSRIMKHGTIDVDMVETTPFVRKGKLYRFEYVRSQYYGNTTGDSYFRIVDVKDNKTVSVLAKGFHLGSAYAENDVVYCFGVNMWDGDTVSMFRSEDLCTWEETKAFHLPGWGIFNTSVCKTDKGYLMTFEIGKPPEETGVPFTMRFAVSDNLKDWRVLPKEYAFTYDRYSACGTIRFYDGYLYMIYLEAVKDLNSKYGISWEEHIVRTKDLRTWEESDKNPVLHYSEEDQIIINKHLSSELCEKIRQAYNVNNSDIDFCEFNGQTVIYYSWGNQHGNEFLAYATYEGTEQDFLERYFL